jgi:hypothetical protein
MLIERFFGKSRVSRGKPGGEIETKSRRSEVDSNPAEATTPRIVATDAPASLARAGTGAQAEPSTMPPIAVAGVSRPSNGEIAARAYELWESQGWPDGREREHWDEAERQLCGE